MKAFTTLAVLFFCGFASCREITPPELIADECAPEPLCYQCLNGVFPADLCCRDVETYHKLHLVDGKDCSSYYQCVNGHPFHRQCPAGLHWSVDSDRCEHPADAKCNGNGGSNGEDDKNNVEEDNHDENNYDNVKDSNDSLRSNEEDHSGDERNNRSGGSAEDNSKSEDSDSGSNES